MKKTDNRQKSKNNRKWVIISVVPVVVILALSVFLMNQSGRSFFVKSDKLVVAKVDGEPIYVQEFKQRMVLNRAGIYSYFNQKYGVEDNSKFWTSSYGGEVPVDKNRKQSIDECVRIKVQQILAKQKGLMQDISYMTFLDNFKKENKRRKEAVQNNQVIYGPVEYSEEGFFNYVFSNMVIKLKEKMAQKETAPADDEIKAYYAVNVDKFKKGYSVKVQKIYIPFIGDEGNNDETKKQEAKAAIEEAKARLDRGEKFEDVAKLFNRDGKVIEQVYDNESRRRAQKTNILKKPSSYDHESMIMAMSEGQVSSIIEQNGAFEIVRCIERKNLGIAAFDEVKDAVKEKMSDEKYEEYIDRLVKGAKVEIVENVYKNVTSE